MTDPEQRVRGHANPGDVVQYEDMANQPARAYRVVSGPHDFGQYEIVGLEDGLPRSSDLRQHGWTFVSRGESLQEYIRKELARLDRELTGLASPTAKATIRGRQAALAEVRNCIGAGEVTSL